jgi:hypothetical protein
MSARRSVRFTPETLPIFERRIKNASEWLLPRPANPARRLVEKMDRALRKKAKGAKEKV